MYKNNKQGINLNAGGDINNSGTLTSKRNKSNDNQISKDQINYTNIFYESYRQFDEIRESFKEEPRDPLANGSKREILEELCGKEIIVTGLTVKLFKEYIINKFTNTECAVVTFVNLIYKGNFIADHVQLNIDLDVFEKYMVGEILTIKGIVYPYMNNNTEETKYSIVTSNIIKEHYPKLNLEDIKSLEIYENVLEDKETYEHVLKIYKEEKGEMFELLDLLLKLLDEVSGVHDFISKYIINQYLINSNPTILNNKLYEQLKTDERLANDLVIMLLYIIYKLSSEDFKSLTDIFELINICLNGIHQLNPKHLDFKTLNKKAINNHLRFRDNTCKRLNVIPKKAFKYIKDRNSNFDNQSLVNPMEMLKYALAVYSADNLYEMLGAMQIY